MNEPYEQPMDIRPWSKDDFYKQPKMVKLFTTHENYMEKMGEPILKLKAIMDRLDEQIQFDRLELDPETRLKTLMEQTESTEYPVDYTDIDDYERYGDDQDDR